MVGASRVGSDATVGALKENENRGAAAAAYVARFATFLV